MKPVKQRAEYFCMGDWYARVSTCMLSKVCEEEVEALRDLLGQMHEVRKEKGLGAEGEEGK